MSTAITTIAPVEAMTSREIADLFEKRHADVLEKIRGLEPAYVDAFGTERKFPLSDYTDPTGRKLPEYSLDKSQSLFIASRFSPALHAKVQKRWEELEAPLLTDPLDLIILQATATKRIQAEQRVQKAEQERQALLLGSVADKLTEFNGETGYRTVTAWCKKHGVKLSLKAANALGRKAAKLCRRIEAPIGKVPDERWDEVNSYPIEVLDEVYAAM